MTETRETRIKRLRMRSWRRGIKEMDLILGGFADAELAGLDAATLDATLCIFCAAGGVSALRPPLAARRCYQYFAFPAPEVSAGGRR